MRHPASVFYFNIILYDIPYFPNWTFWSIFVTLLGRCCSEHNYNLSGFFIWSSFNQTESVLLLWVVTVNES